ncbi:hypothetical protein FVEN_g12826 [Fusarium venenatum]|nr:hypothetical protein FVEN_g12826 [Fusarium venenatum]
MVIRNDGSDLQRVSNSPANVTHAVWYYNGLILWSIGMYGFRDDSTEYETTFQPHL